MAAGQCSGGRAWACGSRRPALPAARRQRQHAAGLFVSCERCELLKSCRREGPGKSKGGRSDLTFGMHARDTEAVVIGQRATPRAPVLAASTWHSALPAAPSSPSISPSSTSDMFVQKRHNNHCNACKSSAHSVQCAERCEPTATTTASSASGAHACPARWSGASHAAPRARRAAAYRGRPRVQRRDYRL